MSVQPETEAKTEGRMRLTILGGFLGSGKTTWLRHQLHEGRFGNAYVIVNEAAEMPVDDALVGKAARLKVLAGGCACCEGRPQLVATLRALCDERSAMTKDRPQEIVLETSGLADPAPIAEAIRTDMMLAYHIVLGEIVVAADALNCLSQMQTDQLARKQIEVADRIVITKVDEAPAGQIATLVATLRVISPGAAISGAIRGTPAPLPGNEGVAAVELAGAVAERPAAFPVVLHVGEPADWTALTVWLSALLHARGNEVLRVKGVMRTPAGRLLLQSVRKVMQSPEILPEQDSLGGREDNTLVVIGSGYRPEDLQRSLRVFAKAAET